MELLPQKDVEYEEARLFCVLVFEPVPTPLKLSTTYHLMILHFYYHRIDCVDSSYVFKKLHRARTTLNVRDSLFWWELV